MRIDNSDVFNQHPLNGIQQPSVFWGSDEPAATSTFTTQNTGTEYWQYVTANHLKKWRKVKDDDRADDYVLEKGIICQRVLYSQFTDGGSTSGTKDLNATIPAGAVFEQTWVTNITGFTGDTSATVIVGVTGGDTDRYNTGTPSVFTTATAGVDLGVPSGTKWHTAAAVPTVLVTSNADFTAVEAGAMTLTLIYRGAAV